MVESTDIVYTPDNVAKVIIDRYQPTGSILDPCSGDGAFLKNLPNADWAEIQAGVDFFSIHKKYDWIVSNPPYSILTDWLRHSFSIADNIVYLLPVTKVFSSRQRLTMMEDYGGIVEVFVPWSGRDIGFDFGWPCGAVYYRKGYKGATIITC